MRNKKGQFINKWDKILTKEFLIQEYWNNKKSIHQIAKEVRCSESTIWNYLIKFNIQIRTISEAQRGKKPNNFKGRIKDSNGYILIYIYNHPFKNIHNQIFEHRLVVEKEIGRYLDPKWVVHHIDGIRDNNRLENLMCFVSRSAHRRIHGNPNNVKDFEIIFDGRKYNDFS